MKTPINLLTVERTARVLDYLGVPDISGQIDKWHREGKGVGVFLGEAVGEDLTEIPTAVALTFGTPDAQIEQDMPEPVVHLTIFPNAEFHLKAFLPPTEVST